MTDHALDWPLLQVVDLAMKVLLLVLIYHVVRDARRLKVVLLASVMFIGGCAQAFTLDASLTLSPAGLVFRIDASADDPPSRFIQPVPAKPEESEKTS